MNDTIEGRIYKGIGGFYMVDTPAGIYTCRARGKFRNEDETPCVGDLVTVRISDAEKREGTVQTIHPRRNRLVRPPVSNVDRMVVVLTPARPLPNLLMVDKLLAACEQADIRPILCFNKQDVSSVAPLEEVYRPCGYPIFVTSATQKTGISALVEALHGMVTVFAGNSGVGKSSLINAVNEDFALETGEISEKLERGRHTTRHVEFYRLRRGGFVADTPGFSRLELSDMEKEKLAPLFPEMRPYLGRCRYSDCSHTSEPGCAVIEAVHAGKIHKQRHENYRLLYEELWTRQRNQWK